MRTDDVTTTLTAAQKAVGRVLCKVVLTKTGEDTQTYSHASTDRILDLRHPEEEWGQTAQVVVQDDSGTLAALALEGYTGTISYGFNTTDGDEYSACAPLEVIAQRTDSMQGKIVTSFGLAGVFNFMGQDEASEAYNPASTNTDTVETILTAIARATMACFSHCKDYTLTVDSRDTLVNVFIPADYFSVGFKESRLSAFKKALSYTKCKARVEADGAIHIRAPTVSGTTYDYEYNDAIAAANHNFFSKSTRQRLILPNKVIVSSHPDHDAQYKGSATDPDSYAALGRYITEHHYVRPTSNAQCSAIATAMIQNYQLAAERGHGFAPMNVYQEVLDYVKITDSRVSATDYRIGNIGYLNRHYTPTKFEFEFGFGKLSMPGLAGAAPVGVREENISSVVDAHNSLASDVMANREAIIDIIDYLSAREEVIPKLHVTEQLIIPVVNE